MRTTMTGKQEHDPEKRLDHFRDRHTVKTSCTIYTYASAPTRRMLCLPERKREGKGINELDAGRGLTYPSIYFCIAISGKDRGQVYASGQYC